MIRYFLRCEVTGSYLRVCPFCWTVRISVIACLAILLACSSAQSRPRALEMSRLERDVDALIPRVHRLVAEVELRREVQAAQDDILRARRPQKRHEAVRRTNLALRRR